jgi:ribosomal protein S18 acetylase RimI-like enzyme
VNEEPELSLREVTATDVPLLIPMMRQLALQEPALPFDERAVAAAWTQFLANAEFGRAWLLCVGSELAGYVILTLGFSFEYRGRDAFIDELYIDVKFRRKGLGRRAIEFVEERARELHVNAIHLEVDRSNAAALELYRRSGYVDHDRYLMTKWVRRTDS